MLTGVFIYTLPPIDETEANRSKPLFDACLNADIQYLYGCATINDIFGKIETFCFQHQGEKYQLLAIIPTKETLIALLRELYPEIKLIFWSQELASNEIFKRWSPMSAGRYHDDIDIAGFVHLIDQLNKTTTP